MGDELTDKEKKVLQRTLTDLASVIPIGFLMLLPVSSNNLVTYSCTWECRDFCRFICSNGLGRLAVCIINITAKKEKNKERNNELWAAFADIAPFLVGEAFGFLLCVCITLFCIPSLVRNYFVVGHCHGTLQQLVRAFPVIALVIVFSSALVSPNFIVNRESIHSLPAFATANWLANVHMFNVR